MRVKLFLLSFFKLFVLNCEEFKEKVLRMIVEAIDRKDLPPYLILAPVEAKTSCLNVNFLLLKIPLVQLIWIKPVDYREHVGVIQNP